MSTGDFFPEREPWLLASQSCHSKRFAFRVLLLSPGLKRDGVLQEVWQRHDLWLLQLSLRAANHLLEQQTDRMNLALVFAALIGICLFRIFGVCHNGAQI